MVVSIGEEHELKRDCGDVVESRLGLASEGRRRDIIENERRWVVVSGGGGIAGSVATTSIAKNWYSWSLLPNSC